MQMLEAEWECGAQYSSAEAHDRIARPKKICRRRPAVVRLHLRPAKLIDDRSPLSRDREEATPAVPAPSPHIEPAAPNRRGTQSGTQR
jgi:hypothetical protein